MGKLALNLVGCPAAAPPAASPLAAALRSALPALVPASHVLPLSLDLLNQAPMVPRKDYTLNRWAQLSVLGNQLTQCTVNFGLRHAPCSRGNTFSLLENARFLKSRCSI